MKFTQGSLASNRSESGGSKFPKQPSTGERMGSGEDRMRSMKNMDQRKVADMGLDCKKGYRD